MTDQTDIPPPANDPASPAPISAGTPKGTSRKAAAFGVAAVGIGSAAIAAALLYTRRR